MAKVKVYCTLCRAPHKSRPKCLVGGPGKPYNPFKK